MAARSLSRKNYNLEGKTDVNPESKLSNWRQVTQQIFYNIKRELKDGS